jgi:hypothetical protein
MSKNRAKEANSAGLSTVGPPVQLNDVRSLILFCQDTWNAFILALLPTPESDARAKNLLQETIASGSRPKFSYIQKADINAWALANAKGNEVCREMKTILEAEPEVPDSLFAKVLKARLLQLKDENVERICVEKQDVADGDKKKADDRAKSSKKPGVKGAAVEEQRPESASKSESKRKNKIREKSGKSDLKPVASIIFYAYI